MADWIFGVPGARNHQKPSKIDFARFLSSPSTPGPNLAPMDLCGIFGFSSPSTLGPYNSPRKARATIGAASYHAPQLFDHQNEEQSIPDSIFELSRAENDLDLPTKRRIPKFGK